MRRGLFLTVLLLLAVVAVSGYAESGSAAVSDTAQVAPASNHKIMVYYLYFNPRCETCLNMEAYSKEAVETGFAQEIKAGKVEWHAYDVDKEPYKHFWTDFKMDTKELIMLDMVDGKQVRWKNCDKIWDLANVKPDFLTYVQNEVRAYLSGK
jgi:hypothetical protein